MQRTLILASGSPTRRMLLDRLRLRYLVHPADVDETPADGETPPDLALRLARSKAVAIGADQPDALIIGSDQVAVLDGQALGKPGGFDKARRQLLAASGREMHFYCGVCLLDTASDEMQTSLADYRVRFRRLSEAQIDAYLALETPWDCCGSFRAEGLGIALFESHSGDDPTALLGLPLMRLTRMLAVAGVDVLTVNVTRAR